MRLVLCVSIVALVAQVGLSGCGGSNNPSRIVVATGGSGSSLGSGGSAGAVTGTGGTTFSPVCSDVPLTVAGVAPTKGGVCASTDAQLCYKTCGPLSIGFKSETCTGGTYAEMSGCSFPAGDYSCYKIPTTIDLGCPATVPQAGQPCSVAECAPCNVGGNYLDSSGASKVGYCVCPPPGEDGMRKWSCASSTAWPCPAGQGC